ncbi:hypothetical protein [Aeoliella sp. SH292]|uniref:hypothetical protein n=1 Tax=Aeoliella sp. SH292 TaxID=3454464 RepID=UPI003F9A2109
MSNAISKEDVTKSNWRYSPLIGWLVAVVPPLVYPFVMMAVGALLSLNPPRLDSPEPPNYPAGVERYEDLSPKQKQAYHHARHERHAKIDKPLRDFYLGWIAVTITSMVGCLGVYLTSPLPLFKAWNLLAGVTIAFIYTLLGFFMLIAWSFRHG